MFDRKKYKKFALIQLNKRWTIPVVITFISGLIVGLVEFPDILTSIKLISRGNEELTAASTIYSEIRSIIVCFICYVLAYAQTHVYLKMSRGPEPVSLGDFFEGFTKWGRSILAGIWQNLWETLWSLLFIIPGIVKHYSYCMTRFIVMEYPEIPVTKALRISKVITYGHRMDIFIMELSFLGWSLLCLLTCGIGFFWLTPYMQLSLTNAYHSILTEAIETGKLKKEDLAGEK